MNPDQRQCIRRELQIQLAAGKRRLFRRRKRGFAVQLLHLFGGWIEWTSHGSVFRQDVAMSGIDPLDAQMRPCRKMREGEMKGGGGTLFAWIDEIPCG